MVDPWHFLDQENKQKCYLKVYSSIIVSDGSAAALFFWGNFDHTGI